MWKAPARTLMITLIRLRYVEVLFTTPTMQKIDDDKAKTLAVREAAKR